MTSRTEFYDSFSPVTALLQPEIVPGQLPMDDYDPFNTLDHWEELGEKVQLDDISNETDISLRRYRSDLPDQALILVRSSNWHTTDVSLPRVEVTLVDSSRLSAVKWEAYGFNGEWKGDWSLLSPDSASATAIQIESGRLTPEDSQA